MVWQQRVAIATKEPNPLPPCKQRLVGAAWGADDVGPDNMRMDDLRTDDVGMDNVKTDDVRMDEVGQSRAGNVDSSKAVKDS